MIKVHFNDSTIQRFRKFRSQDGVKILRKEGGQPMIEPPMKITPGDEFDLCDEQAAIECSKRLGFNDDGSPKYRFTPVGTHDAGRAAKLRGEK